MSACHTAVSSSDQPDEAENLATAFQHLGYKKVIGSLWWVLGTRAAEVAEAFYTGLDNSLDSAAAQRDAIPPNAGTVRTKPLCGRPSSTSAFDLMTLTVQGWRRAAAPHETQPESTGINATAAVER